METPPTSVLNSEDSYVSELNHLITCLQNENEAEFVQRIDSIRKKGIDQLTIIFQATDKNASLLTLAIEMGLAKAVEEMLRLGANVNAVVDRRHGSWNSVELACYYGHWEVLEVIVKSPKLDLSKSKSILLTVVKNIDEKETTRSNYKKCFQLLINHKDIDVNQLDAYGFSPLHYAVKYNNSVAIIELMRRGAYIGQTNRFNRYGISNIKPELLKKHFDECITTNNFRFGDDNFEIRFEYSSLLPVSPHKQIDKKSTVKENEKEFVDNPHEMTAIECMSKSKNHRHLLMHPLIKSFLFLKWNQFAFTFYLNFMLTLLFAVSTSIFIYFCYLDGRNVVGSSYTFFQGVTLLLTFFIVFREISQFGLSPLAYLRGAENYMEWVMIALVIIVLFDFYEEDRPILAGSLIVLIGIEMFHLAGSLPFGSFSIHYAMLKKVISSFVETILHYIIPILLFALAFYVLLRGSPELVQNAGKLPKEFEQIPKEFQNLAKIINLLSSYSSGIGVTLLSCFFFAAFITPTIFLNLLNAIAVIELRAIKLEAELTNLIHRCQVLSRYEKTLVNNQHWVRVPILKKCFCLDLMRRFKKLGMSNRIGVKTNANNKISMLNAESDNEPLVCKRCFSYFGRSSQMDDAIVNSANEIFEEMHSKKDDLLREEIQDLKSSIELMRNELNQRR